MAEIVELLDRDDKRFWDYVLKDVPYNFFFILDLKQYPENSHFFMALENDCIVGLCLIWKHQVAHVRGKNEDVVKTLFNAIPKEIPITQINFEYKYKALLKDLIPNPKHEISMHRMMLNKEKILPRFPLDKPFTQRKLTEEDAPLIAELMAKADPKFWGNMKASSFTFDENNIYTGLFDGQQLISYTLAWIDEDAAIIATAVTHPKYQNQGLATYLVNESIHTMMDRTDIAIIHVVTDNEPALKVYSKVGYEVYATFAMVGI